MKENAGVDRTVDNHPLWAGYYPPGIDTNLTAQYGTMRDAWDAQVASQPEAPAVHYFDVTLTFTTIDAAAIALSAALLDAGTRSGDRVAVYLQNDPQWLVAMLAAWKVGAIPVAINPMLRSEELSHHLKDSGASTLICLDLLYSDSVLPIVDQMDLSLVVTTHPLDMAPSADVPESMAAHVSYPRGVFSGTRDWLDIMRAEPVELPEAITVLPTDIGVLTYTSGTTGPSKGAMNLHHALMHNATVYAQWWNLRGDRDVVVCIAPVFHITGLVAGFGVHIVSGSPIVLFHRFDAELTLHAIERWRGTFMIAASTAFVALADHPARSRYDLSSLTKTPSGGAAVSQALVDRVAANTGWVLRGAYGMTETTSPTHLGPVDIDPPVDSDTGALAVGVPVPGAGVRIVDPTDGREVEPGGMGEIVVSGPMVVPGYWKHPEESAHAIRDGWLYTGDIGRMTADGWLFVIDRLKDMIVAGGYKVFPRDVEDVLGRHHAVREASVIGVPDEYRGETVKAFVSLRAGQTATPAELIDFCKEHLAAYKYPREVVVLDDLPKTSSGKLLRRALRSKGPA
jgi:long-chain acyl-CoA synthetase